ncbi:MAG: hypothetical protein ACI9BW_002311 [Gammaproteobacteria bacterium]|jgi:hypothetical protein
MLMSRYVEKEMDYVIYRGPFRTTLRGQSTTSSSGIGNTRITGFAKRLPLEVGIPIIEDLNGPRMQIDVFIAIGLQISFFEEFVLRTTSRIEFGYA